MFQLVISTENGTPADVAGADSIDHDGPRTIATWASRPTSLVAVGTDRGGFSLWPDEVSSAHPVVLTHLGVSVSTGDDRRPYAELVDAVRRGGRTALQQIAEAPEDSFADAAARSRDLAGPIWLGLGRDFRTFAASYRSVGSGRGSERLWDWIAPQWHGQGVVLPEDDRGPTRYQYMVGRGLSSQQQIVRRLRNGVLPVLEADITDGPLTYHTTSWVGLERSTLTAANNHGTDFLLADGRSAGHMFTPEQQARFDALEAGHAPEEETVFHTRIEVANHGTAPRHAFVALPLPYATEGHLPTDHSFDPVTGTSAYSADRVFGIFRVNGEPAPQQELSIVVPPGATLRVDIAVPHRPVSSERAAALAAQDLDAALAAVVTYWEERLTQAATIEVPEPRITEMVAAGLLHLDLVAYGTEPDGTLAPTIGVYAPIGSESGPIIQFFDSMGWSDVAARSLQYFLDKQHDDGFMQNFGGYMLETEAALWSFGEHWRYTRDRSWLAGVAPGITAAVEYILRNREQQRRPGGQRHGLIVGKTADPEDPFAAYMLNGFAHVGISRAAEMMAELDPELAARWQSEATRLRDDIRASLTEAVAASPVVPLGDGTWSRTAPPWADHPGPLALSRSGERWFTHGYNAARDTLLGPLWLATQEVLEPDEQLTTELLEYHSDVFFHDNAAFSQPYYSTHQLTHLRRGEVKEFLTPYYAVLSALADRETYSFWEHYFHASPHKTHEEGWFLMQTRWMLYLEQGATLRLFPGIPRAWLAAGQRIVLDGVRSYFGALGATAEVSEDGQLVEVAVDLDPERRPERLAVRLPHPDGPRSAAVSSGTWDMATETVSVEVTEPTVRLQVRWN